MNGRMSGENEEIEIDRRLNVTRAPRRGSNNFALFNLHFIFLKGERKNGIFNYLKLK